MSLKQFLTSRTFAKHFIASIVVTLVLITLVLLFLRIYTRHGREYVVPDLTGMTEDEFREALDNVHLRFRVADTTYNADVKPGGVIDQVPDAGAGVKRNRIIFLTVNATSPGMVALPQVADISYRQAVAQLESAGLTAGNITYEPSEFQNLVLKAKTNGRVITEGEMVAKGSVIDLVLGSGDGGTTIQPPDLKGFTPDEARISLERISLHLGAFIYDETVLTAADTLAARIFRQHPDPKLTAHTFANSSVDIWLTVDPAKFTKETDEEEDLNF